MQWFRSSWSQEWRVQLPLGQQWWAGTRMENRESWLVQMPALTLPAPSRPLLTCWIHLDLLLATPAGGRVWLLPPSTAALASTAQDHTPENVCRMPSSTSSIHRAPPALAPLTGSTPAPMTSTQSLVSTIPSGEMVSGKFPCCCFFCGHVESFVLIHYVQIHSDSD